MRDAFHWKLGERLTVEVYLSLDGVTGKNEGDAIWCKCMVNESNATYVLIWIFSIFSKGQRLMGMMKLRATFEGSAFRSKFIPTDINPDGAEALLSEEMRCDIRSLTGTRSQVSPRRKSSKNARDDFRPRIGSSSHQQIYYRCTQYAKASWLLSVFAPSL